MSETSMPTIETLQEATWNNLKGKLEDDAIRKFLETAGPRISAIGSLAFAGIIGRVKCHPTENPYSSWYFDNVVWGAGVAEVEGIAGTLSNNVGGWDDFFRKTTGCHVQTTTYYGGWLQINFLQELNLIGQFNGLVAGVGLCEAGGNGKWEKR